MAKKVKRQEIEEAEHRIEFRVDKQEKVSFKKKADAEGRSVSNLLKHLMRTYEGPNGGRSGQSTSA